jgi:thymidylate synthase
MKYIHAENTNDAFIQAFKLLKKEGTVTQPRDQKVLELRDCLIEIEDISDPICTLPECPTKKSYVDAELDWYLSGDLRVETIAQHSKFWTKLANPNGTLNSQYGFLTMIQQWNGKSQFQWCLESLQKDPDTRQAIMNYNQPIHKFEGNKDFVCTINQNFRLSYDKKKVETQVSMRSNDLYLGTRNDLPWFAYVQKEMANQLGKEIGLYTHFAYNLHIYENRWNVMEEICQKY